MLRAKLYILVWIFKYKRPAHIIKMLAKIIFATMTNLI